MSDKPTRTKTESVIHPAGRPVGQPVSWNDVGDGFETLSKIGLALAVGMSAASIFCRLADQKKVRIPTLWDLTASLQPPVRHRRPRVDTSPQT